jgi:hypothetical protein
MSGINEFVAGPGELFGPNVDSHAVREILGLEQASILQEPNVVGNFLRGQEGKGTSSDCHRRVWFDENPLRISAHQRKYHEFRHFPSGRTV